MAGEGGRQSGELDSKLGGKPLVQRAVKDLLRGRFHDGSLSHAAFKKIARAATEMALAEIGGDGAAAEALQGGALEAVARRALAVAERTTSAAAAAR